MSNEPEMLKVKEVAQRLRIGLSAAYRLCRTPDFPAVWVGGQIRVPTAGLSEWLAESRRETQEHARAA